MALIAFTRGRQQPGGGGAGGLERGPGPAGPSPTPRGPSPTPGERARSFYESVVREEPAGNPPEGSSSPPPHFCPSCGTGYRDPPARHRSSTAHLLGAPPPPGPSPFQLPPTSRGFRLLLRGGWDGRGGLGPAGGGALAPVPTVLKRDRGGLGCPGGGRRAARVTHFGPRDVRAVAGPAPPPPRKRRRKGGGGAARSREAERAWERRLRWYMGS